MITLFISDIINTLCGKLLNMNNSKLLNMKTINLVLFSLIISLTSCNKENNGLNPYKDKYVAFEPVINDKIAALVLIDKDFVDSTSMMTNNFITELGHLSCVYCVDEGLTVIFPEYCRKHHEALLFVAERYFRGYDGRLRFAFQTLFKEFYPDSYILLLKEANINLDSGGDMTNREKEYQLSFEILFNKYLEIAINPNLKN